MKTWLLVLLLLVGCASTPPPWYGKAKPAKDVRSADEVAYACSNNAKLTAEFIADLESKSTAQVRFFLVTTYSAWVETAAALTSKS